MEAEKKTLERIRHSKTSASFFIISDGYIKFQFYRMVPQDLGSDFEWYFLKLT